MQKNIQRLQHGEHNEAVCDYLELRQEFTDWIITTAFYSSLQFVSYRIFPLECPAIAGETTMIHSVDEYYSYKQAGNSRAKKHDLLADLVSKYCNAISEEYDWLLSMSMTARYVQYGFPPEIGNKARTLMKKIKSFCAAM